MSDAATNSVAMQRYAAELFRLQEENPLVPLSLLSDVIGASPQAVSQMTRRMSQRALLVHEPYRGVRLTEEGRRIAMPALRRHRLTEVFLVRIMATTGQPRTSWPIPSSRGSTTSWSSASTS
jgi:Mn-dependent DtxR family transcriptional regulator